MSEGKQGGEMEEERWKTDEEWERVRERGREEGQQSGVREGR